MRPPKFAFARCPWLNWTRRQTVCELLGTVQIDSRLALISWLALINRLALITCSQLEKVSAARKASHWNRGEPGSFLAASLQYLWITVSRYMCFWFDRQDKILSCSNWFLNLSRQRCCCCCARVHSATEPLWAAAFMLNDDDGCCPRSSCSRLHSFWVAKFANSVAAAAAIVLNRSAQTTVIPVSCHQEAEIRWRSRKDVLLQKRRISQETLEAAQSFFKLAIRE